MLHRRPLRLHADHDARLARNARNGRHALDARRHRPDMAGLHLERDGLPDRRQARPRRLPPHRPDAGRNAARAILRKPHGDRRRRRYKRPNRPSSWPGRAATSSGSRPGAATGPRRPTMRRSCPTGSGAATASTTTSPSLRRSGARCSTAPATATRATGTSPSRPATAARRTRRARGVCIRPTTWSGCAARPRATAPCSPSPSRPSHSTASGRTRCPTC